MRGGYSSRQIASGTSSSSADHVAAKGVSTPWCGGLTQKIDTAVLMIRPLRWLAKRLHRPFQCPPLLRVTELTAFDLDKLRRAAEYAPLAQVVCAYYALITAAEVVALDRPAQRPVDPARRSVLREVLTQRYSICA